MSNLIRTLVSVAGGLAAASAVLHTVNHLTHKNICMIAHRGHSAKHPGNTEAAFLSAVKNGSGGIETDVRDTAEGVFVVNHNDEVTYEDGTQLLVADHTFAELSEKPIRNTLSTEICYLCTFKRYLEICRDANLICFIELKGQFTDQQIHDLFTMAAEVYDLSMCQLQSFEFENLIKAHESFPDLKIMYTYGKGCPDYRRCFEYGFDIDADYKSATQEMVEEFHSRGLKVGLWTANNLWALNYCRYLDVDFIESDIYGG